MWRLQAKFIPLRLHYVTEWLSHRLILKGLIYLAFYLKEFEIIPHLFSASCVR